MTSYDVTLKSPLITQMSYQWCHFKIP